jgi:hypothetical protein
MRLYIKALSAGALALLASGLYLTGFFEGFMSGFEGHPGLPSCSSSHGQDDAQQAIDNAPFAKASSITILALTEPKSLSASAQKVECTGMVILNTGRKGIINYSFTNDPSLGSGKYFVQASLDLPSFKPYP